MNIIEETISQLEKLKEHCEAMQVVEDRTCYATFIAAVDTAIAIIRKEIVNLGTRLIDEEEIKIYSLRRWLRWIWRGCIGSYKKYSNPMKHGRWVEDKKKYDSFVTCNLCGLSLSKGDYMEQEWREVFNFCPCCGAKMEKDEN